MDEEEGGSEEAVLFQQHRKEKKDLQAKIQSMKNTVPKNDKKRRKQLTEDIAKLEADLEEKHQQELAGRVQEQCVQTEINSVTNGVTGLELGGEVPAQQSRMSKAQKRREKKAALEKERDERIAEAEVENLSGARHLESQKLAHILSERQLQIKHIPSDGHCMYRAIEHQLKEQGANLTLSSLRHQTADYMQSHADDFLPFLTNSTTGEMYTQDEFEKYCSEIANTPAWGGQLELRALSHILKTPIEVIQADSAPVVIGEEYGDKPVTVLYMRYAYGLGEHYNSIEPLSAAPTE
ncbi:PREDICTED: OTU domain-containing protein 6B [Nanorana parkeri]|uniref:OTU domain-containing protein 6B n=1 Tax=Nanorana parkeri TaxID=125878 RepID=UPI0008544C78|nr:PREDICTED: OTU domain-containing protein 6B [Nanorana parkeri]